MSLRKSKLWLLLAGIILLILALALSQLPVCTEYHFLDETTGSRKGHREWVLGFNSGDWYTATALETFIRTNNPGLLKPRWVSSGGEKRNIYGSVLSFLDSERSHAAWLGPGLMKHYCARLSDTEKTKLYEMLLEGDPAKIDKLAKEVYQLLYGEMENATDP
jgi:hypothetical protein